MYIEIIELFIIQDLRFNNNRLILCKEIDVLHASSVQCVNFEFLALFN